jgi:hypothetical protein
MSDRVFFPIFMAATWIAAAGPLLPELPRAIAAGAALLLLPGLALERAFFPRELSRWDLGALARWITASVGTPALAGLVASRFGASIDAVLTGVFAISLVAALRRAKRLARAGVQPPKRASRFGETIAVVALAIIVIVSVYLAAVAPNIARDRMWYLAFLTDLASGRVIDGTEPFLGTGNPAPRFANNGWLIALAAWAKLGDLAPSLVFERWAPTLVTAATTSAAWQLAKRAVPTIPALTALSVGATLLATRYPFFSPDRYAFFSRAAEDKTVALLIFVPVAIAAIVDVIVRDRRPNAAPWLMAGLALVAVGFSHALVLMLLGLTMAALLPLSAFGSGFEPRRLLVALGLAAAVAFVPARMGLQARAQIVESENPAAAWSDDPTHPVVRAHLRMARLRELPAGGPIVDPGLVAEPLLLLGLAGIPFAWARRRTASGALLLAMSLPPLVLAFMPVVAPSFGRLVLPWMAYRALWILPFGYLLALAIEAMTSVETRRGMIVRVLAAVALAGSAWTALPWERASEGDVPLRSNRDANLGALIDAIAMLPPDSLVAAAPGVSELLPALAGRHVLAFSDRGTVVFAGSRVAAERRLEAAAAITGLAPGNARLRRGLAAAHGVTHAVLDGPGCGRLGETIFRSGSLHLCRISPPSRERSPALSSLERSANGRPRLAKLDAGIECDPKPERNVDSIFQWRRGDRWSARALAIDCHAELAEPAARIGLHLTPDLPRAREAIVFRSVVVTAAGKRVRRRGLIELDGSDPVVVELGGKNVRAVSFRLVPAYLPYLNLRDLSLLE